MGKTLVVIIRDTNRPLLPGLGPPYEGRAVEIELTANQEAALSLGQTEYLDGSFVTLRPIPAREEAGREG